MSFYDLSKIERQKLVEVIHSSIEKDIKKKSLKNIHTYFSDEDTYIRKAAYLSIGKIYKKDHALQSQILQMLQKSFEDKKPNVRQTVINAAGEIGMFDADPVLDFLEKGLFDQHHSVRNAVVGSMKKMGEKNPAPTLLFAKKILHHPEDEIRREICHGIELRGRTHPEDILPMLEELQHEKKRRVRKMLIHVLGQIAYKKGCLEKVVAALKKWENKELVKEALAEILDVHIRYKDFSYKTHNEAKAYIRKSLNNLSEKDHGLLERA